MFKMGLPAQLFLRLFYFLGLLQIGGVDKGLHLRGIVDVLVGEYAVIIKGEVGAIARIVAAPPQEFFTSPTSS